jgi:hypothetical protein
MNHNFSLVKDFMDIGSNHQIISFFIYEYEISLSFSLIVFNRVSDNMIKRVKLCLESNGNHFQHLL